MSGDDRLSKEAEPPAPEPIQPPCSLVTGWSHLWKEEPEGPKVADDNQPSIEVEPPASKSIPPPLGCLVDWPQFWRAGPVGPNEGGEPPSP